MSMSRACQLYNGGSQGLGSAANVTVFLLFCSLLFRSYIRTVACINNVLASPLLRLCSFLTRIFVTFPTSIYSFASFICLHVIYTFMGPLLVIPPLCTCAITRIVSSFYCSCSSAVFGPSLPFRLLVTFFFISLCLCLRDSIHDSAMLVCLEVLKLFPIDLARQNGSSEPLLNLLSVWPLKAVTSALRAHVMWTRLVNRSFLSILAESSLLS